MARVLLIANPENATIEELKQVSRVGSNETATRCSAIQIMATLVKPIRSNAAMRRWFGMVCPRSGAFFAIEASHSDSATYQAFLDEADKTISFQRTTNILIMDTAS
jgi:hypothetical protein